VSVHDGDGDHNYLASCSMARKRKERAAGQWWPVKLRGSS
jgi:hypothetical protein